MLRIERGSRIGSSFRLTSGHHHEAIMGYMKLSPFEGECPPFAVPHVLGVSVFAPDMLEQGAMS